MEILCKVLKVKIKYLLSTRIQFFFWKLKFNENYSGYQKINWNKKLKLFLKPNFDKIKNSLKY